MALFPSHFAAAGLLDGLPPALRLIEFGDPRWLWLLLVLVPVWWLWRTSRVPGSRGRRWMSLVLRVVLIASLVLALARARLVWHTDGVCVAFLIDQSASVLQVHDAIRQQIDDAVKKMSKDDQFVIIEFGGDAVLANLPGPRGELPPPAHIDDPGHTDIARALRLAMATLPADRQKRIVIFSDGEQNIGDALHEARVAAADDVDINTVLLAGAHPHEVMLEQLILPPRVNSDTHFTAKAIISADQAQSAQLRITRDGQALPTRPVQLKAGVSVIEIDDALKDAGFHSYEVTIEPQSPAMDGFSQNNTAVGHVLVDAPGKVLLVRGAPATQDYIGEALVQDKIAVQAGSVEALPTELAEYMKYDCVVLDNVGAQRLSNAQMAALARWVKDFGGGVVFLGGDDAYGPGGWKGTLLEELAPVEMDVKRKKNMATVAMVIVLDKSGSMGAPAGDGHTKMELANQGAVETLKLLGPNDEAQIGAVDTEVKWMSADHVVPMDDLDKSRLRSNTLANRAGGGGIYCKTALYHAYRLLARSDVTAMTRHVILFADTADSEQQEDCIDMARRFASADPPITLTVIGLGNLGDSDVAFQKELAAAGKGRWYITDDALKLPRFFAKEAFIAARSAFVERKEGIPLTIYESPLFQGFKQTGLPRVYGYVGTTLKPRATLAASGLEPDDPLLAHWVIGLGKTVAWTSDATNRWSKDWVSWPGYNKFWGQIVRWAGRSVHSGQVATRTTIVGSDGHVVVEANDAAGQPVNNLQLQARIVQPDPYDPTARATLTQVAPGRYEAAFPVRRRGTYLVSITDQTTGSLLDTSGVDLSYPPEFRDLRPNAALLKALAETTGGRQRTDLDGIFIPKPRAVASYWPLWVILMVTAAIGLLIDVAWRRLNIADWVRRSPAPVPAAATGPGAVGALRQIHAGRQDVQRQTQTLRERIAVAASAPAVLRGVDGRAEATPDVVASPVRRAAVGPSDTGGYTNRLLGAKKRAADQIRDQQEKK